MHTTAKVVSTQAVVYALVTGGMDKYDWSKVGKAAMVLALEVTWWVTSGPGKRPTRGDD